MYMKRVAVKGKKIDFDWDKFDLILQFKPSKKTCADVMECSDETIDRRIKQKYDCSFMEYRDRKMGKIKLKLCQKAIEMSLSGNTAMMIFTLKNLCDWRDKPEDDTSVIDVAKIKIDSGDIKL
jgi:hypothetical protein